MAKTENTESFTNDPGWQAYKKAKSSGLLRKLEPNRWLHFKDGELTLTSLDKNQLMKRLDEEGIEGGFLTQVSPKRVVHIRGPRHVVRIPPAKTIDILSPLEIRDIGDSK